MGIGVHVSSCNTTGFSSIQTTGSLPRERSFIQPQHVLHAGVVLLIQLRHAPHFFPATASDRGFRAVLVWSPALRVEPTCAGSPLRSAAVRSSVPVPPAAASRPPR